MTRARIRTSGLGNPPRPQHWLVAALCALVSLVAQLFQPRRKQIRTATLRVAVDAQRRTPTLTHTTDTNPTHASFSGLSRESRFSPRRNPQSLLAANNRDAWDKPKHDTDDADRSPWSSPVIPDARNACEPEPRGQKPRRHPAPRLAFRAPTRAVTNAFRVSPPLA